MMNEITLRPATLADADILGQLWAVVFADKFGPILGRQAGPVLGDWLRLSRRHLQTTTLAQIEETVAGFIVLETPTAPRPDDGRWLWHALQLHNGFLGALYRLLLVMLVDRHRKASGREVYIEMLGVNPLWRRRGVARRLLAYAEAEAQTHTVERLALTVASDNLRAIDLYHKMGFLRTGPEQCSRSLRWITGHSGYYEMVKRLRPQP